jgi:sulfonate transport system substrate-binding protein
MTIPTVHYTRCPGVPTISAIAHARGLIADEFDGERDLAFHYQSVGFSPKLEYGDDDRYWIRNAGHAPAVWKKSKGVDCRLIGLAFLDGRYPVLSLRASGIDAVTALKGRRLAVFRNVDSPFDLMVAQQLKIYQTTLRTAGLGLEDVELVEIGRAHPPANTSRQGFLHQVFHGALAALEDGRVDAVAASIPPDAGAYPALNVLYDTRLSPDPLARVHPSVLRGLVVSGPLFEERRDIVVRVLARLLDAGAWALAHPLDALRLTAEDLRQSPETLAAVYENVAQGVQLDMSPERVAALASHKDFLLRHGLIDQDFDLESWIDRSALAEARVLHAARAKAPALAEG